MALDVLIDAGPWLPVPPVGYGGIETVIATLVPELRRAGHRVTLACAGTPTIEVDEVVTTMETPRFAEIARPYNQVSGIAHAHMQVVVRTLREGSFDLVHDHLEVVGPAVLAAMGAAAPPTLQTLHWDLRKHADFYATFQGDGRVGFAAVSQSQLERAPEALRSQTLGVVPLAVPPPVEVTVTPGQHALLLARITHDKGQDLAARACQAAGVPLVLAGPVAGIGDPEELEHRLRDEPDLRAHADVAYWLEQVAPLVDGELVRWVGGVAGEDKERLLQSAVCLMTPNRWAEPGATGVVEALTRGVPVVGTTLGVLPSLVEHGATGFLVDGESDEAEIIEGLTKVLGRLPEISPAACREVARRWSPQRMAADYISLYEELIERNP